MTPQQANELLPCPFCGGAARIHSNNDWHRLWCNHTDDCMLDADEADLMYPAQPGYLLEIVEVWNRRAPAPTEPAVDRDAVLEEAALACEALRDSVSDGPGGSRMDWPVSQNDCIEAIRAMIAAAPQVAQASQPTSAEELQQDKRMPPVAAPVSQPCADPKVMVELRRWAGDDPGYAARLIRAAITEIEKLESELASRCRAQGGITNDSKGLPTSAEGKDSDNQSQEQA